MADAAVAITAGTGTNIDTQTQANGDHRQVMCVGDPVNATVAFVTSDNRLQVKTDYSAAGTVTGPAVSTTSVTLVTADATNGRLGVILYNDTNQIIYINLNATAATTTAYSFEMPPGAYWESPRNWVGAITAIAGAASTGNMRVTTF